jgi:TolB-like protein
MKIKIIVLIALLMGGIMIQTTAQQKTKKITLAVLYFENNSVVDKDKMEPLKKGIADMLITDLTKIKAFRVVERERLNDVMEELKLNQTNAVDQSTAQKMGKLLGAQTLLLGSFVNFFGGQMRVDLRIVETETGLTLKAEEITDDVDDLFDIIKDLTSKVTKELDIQLTAEEKTDMDMKRGAVNVESSLYYSQAVEKEDEARELYKSGNKPGAIGLYKTAIGLYELALQKNPNLTDATVKLGNLKNLITEIDLPDIKLSKTNPPQIEMLEPAGSESGNIIHQESMIAVRLKAQDENGIENVQINNKKTEPMSNGEFSANISLTPGLNTIPIVVTNKKGFTTEKQINVIVPAGQGTIISITEPAVSRGIKIVSKKDLITVIGTAVDLTGIKVVTVNGRNAILDKNGNFSIQMNLEVGENRLLVKAVNGNKVEKVDTFFVTRNAQEMLAAGRFIAFVIGINSYSGYWHPLNNALNDAKGMAELLKTEYKFDTVITLLDKDATRKNIIQKFEWLANNLKVDDNLLIFYSGHGQLNKVLNKGYWVPVDANSNSVADYISNSDIKIFLGGIPSKHTMLIADACFAGDIFRGSQTEQVPFDPNNMDKYYKEVYRKQSRLALTSGGLEEVMDAGKEGHSIFTYYLIKALKENTKKYIDASQLFNEFSVSVTNNSEQTPQLQAVKDTNHEGGQFVFIKR